MRDSTKFPTRSTGTFYTGSAHGRIVAHSVVTCNCAAAGDLHNVPLAGCTGPMHGVLLS